MGADQRMYPGVWTTLAGIRMHDWSGCSGEGGIRGVAESLASSCGVCDGDCLVGSSLGGMVACEITKIRRIPFVFLLGSALSKQEVSPILSALRSLSDYVPYDWIRFSSGKVPGELAGMFADADPNFVRSMCRAIFEWEGGASPDSTVVRIHGQSDLVIPAPNAVDLLLDGGHLISMTHADQCVAFIRSKLG
jgi:hypothetical protein